MRLSLVFPFIWKKTNQKRIEMYVLGCKKKSGARVRATTTTVLATIALNGMGNGDWFICHFATAKYLL